MRRRLLTAVLLVGVFLLGVVLTGPRSAVDWRATRAVAIESDDWGLAGFVPAAESWRGLDREDLETGRFPAVYWGSTLEDSTTVAHLAAIFTAHRGRDGLPVVFQPNYVMGSLEWLPEVGTWQVHDLPDWPDHYQRPGLWQAVTAARDAGVWHPELHAAFHYDPDLRRQNALGTSLAREATDRGIMLFPGSEKARELGPRRSRLAMTAELDHSLAVFRRVFGRPAESVIAPDYTWHGWIEGLWSSRGLRTVQAKREQQNPLWLSGKPGRVQKVLDRQWARWRFPGRVYLERNCRLEPVQADDPGRVVTACLAATRQAWRMGQPAIVEAHRVNFAHTDSTVRATGSRALARYLDSVCRLDPGPVFLSDSEIALLTRNGVSWRRAGEKLILRNASRAARVICVPRAALGHGEEAQSGVMGFRLNAGAVRVVPVSDFP